jgi:hypothetical protein
MADWRQFEYFLLRYVPDAVTEEFANFAVAVLEQDGGFSDLRLTRDWRRVRCIDPDVEIEMLEAVARDVQSQLSVADDREKFLRRLQESLSGTVQITPMKGRLGTEPAQLLESLAGMYLERPFRRSATALSARQRMVRIMRETFDRAGLSRFMQEQIAFSEFTHAGDPLKVDFGYRVNGILKMFHATPLSKSIDAAKVLAFSYPQYAAGLRRAGKGDCGLTAVFEDNVDRDDSQIGFALSAMQSSGIRTVPESEVPLLAEAARLELRA